MRLPKVLFALNKHTTRVNGVKWLTGRLIVSIESDGKSIAIWQNKGVD